MISLQIEKFADFYPECLPLLAEHNGEIGESENNMPLDIDVDGYAQMCAVGMLQLMTARKDGKLIGYCVFTIGNSLLSKNVLCGTQGPFFVTKQERATGTALRLYRESIKIMKQRGVKNVYPHHWMRGDSEKLGKYFEALGALPVERVYSLWIGE